MSDKTIKSALISVYHKDGLAPIVQKLAAQNVKIYSTGGTYKFIEDQGIEVHKVEDLTTYPSILDGRVKTLHPKVFGGILARREEDHLSQLEKYEIPEIDLVIVDLYPFEETLKNTSDENTIIEKIDIGGIALIRAAAKNYNDVVIIPSMDDYTKFEEILDAKGATTSLADRKHFAARAFATSSHYDTAIHAYFAGDSLETLKMSHNNGKQLRYGENPHQAARYFGDLDELFDIYGSKALSFNNLVDVDAAMNIMAELKDGDPSFAVMKHTNTCGLATRSTTLEAWNAALAGDPVSAFGGILISNSKIDLATAEQINKIFYEVLIAPAFDQDAQELLLKKKNRVLLKVKQYPTTTKTYKSLLNGVITQMADQSSETADNLEIKTNTAPTADQVEDLLFANICAKHLKSNTIVLIKDKQLIGMGCGQTSRVDACEQAIAKAVKMGFDIAGSVMASDAFFPFPDCVEIAHKAGVAAVIQPGGSIKDQLSIDYCNAHGLPMVFTGIRHFKH